jgi:hypothetical protein
VPPTAGKGKAPHLASKVIAAKEGVSQCHSPSGFMIAARHALTPSCKAPTPHVEPVANGWREVIDKKRKWKSASKSHLPRHDRGVPTDLIGLCFNYFSSEHVTRRCPQPIMLPLMPPPRPPSVGLSSAGDDSTPFWSSWSSICPCPTAGVPWGDSGSLAHPSSSWAIPEELLIRGLW